MQVSGWKSEYVAHEERSFSRRKGAVGVAQRRGGGHQEPSERRRAGTGGSDAVPENLEGGRDTQSRKESLDRGLALERHDPALGGWEEIHRLAPQTRRRQLLQDLPGTGHEGAEGEEDEGGQANLGADSGLRSRNEEKARRAG